MARLSFPFCINTRSFGARLLFGVCAVIIITTLFSCRPDKHRDGILAEGNTGDTSISYYKDIAPIIGARCLACHSEKGPGPINLTSYASVSFNAEMIRYVINRHIMPPWLADEHGWDFANKRVLTKQETVLINKWINNGLYKGDSIAVDYVAKYSQIEKPKPDIVLKMDKQFFIKGDNQESFQKATFSFETDSLFAVAAVEIVSKQMKVAHHAAYVIKGRSNFSRSAQEFLLGNDLFKDPSVVMIGGWGPGWGAIRFPEGFGFYLPTKGEVDLEFHYGPSPIDLTDSVEIHIYRAGKPITRTCTFISIANSDSLCRLNPPLFEIPPNQFKRFTMQYPVKKDYTVLAVTPHMHYLGKSYHATLIEPDGKESQMINLAQWNFSWQDQYLCQPFHKIEKGSTIKVEAEFDNTKDNLRNPNTPPKLVRSGWESKSEMLVFILLVTDYLPGDETKTWADGF
jgi:hypothetical protein